MYVEHQIGEANAAKVP